MALDYDKRVDFRAFDVLVDAIDSADKASIKTAYDTAKEQSKVLYSTASRRAIWAEFARMLKKQLSKY